ncbi:leucine-rich repeat protein [Sodaliphilus pleomorphus]|nr:leucine-rich repeat protein [Sodaliphilus pleomorphus]
MERTFKDNVLVKSVKLPNGLKNMEYTFYNASKLTSIRNIPAHLEDAVHCPIYGTPFLKNQPDGVVYFSDWAVSVKGNPKGTLTFKEGTYGISSEIVCYNNSVGDVVLPQSLKVLGSEAFVKILITKLEIPAGCTTIGRNVACKCPFFTKYIVAESNPNYTAVDGILYSKDRKTLENYPSAKLGEVFVCPSGVKDVEEAAFSGNQYLKHIYFQEGVKSVNGDALRDQPLESVSFPSSFTSSSLLLFGCHKLKAVYCHATTPPLAIFPSKEVISEITLYVPAEAIDAYKNHKDWGEFSHFAAIENLPFSIGGKDFDNAALNVISAFLDGGNITYDKDTKTITLDNAVINYRGSNNRGRTNKYAFYVNSDGVKVNLVGDNTISASGAAGGMFLYDNAVITGEGKLTVTSASATGVFFRGPATISGCTLDVTGYTRGIVGSYVDIPSKEIWNTDLTIDNASVTTQVTGNGYPTYNLKSLTLKDCAILQPQGAYFYANKHNIVFSRTLSDIKDKIVIGKVVDYGVNVGTVAVNNTNNEGITGEGISGWVSYDPDTKTLTLHNATISSDKPLKYSVIYFSEDDMTLNLVGNNSVSTSGDMVNAITFYGNGTITGSGKLTARCDKDEAIALGGNTTISNCTLDIKSNYACIFGKYKYIARNSYWLSDVVIDNANITAETQEDQQPLLHFKSLALKNCGIVDPAGAAFNAEKHQIIGKNGNVVTGKIVISNSTAATGDINADGQVNVTDVTALINRVLGTASYSDAVCDLNGDGVVNVSDVTALINIILSNN